jgi:hypothetical protein
LIAPKGIRIVDRTLTGMVLNMGQKVCAETDSTTLCSIPLDSYI